MCFEFFLLYMISDKEYKTILLKLKQIPPENISNKSFISIFFYNHIYILNQLSSEIPKKDVQNVQICINYITQLIFQLLIFLIKTQIQIIIRISIYL
ncbi:hypothetical protein pb186bvf_009859 [Paramecium bursaria]